MLLTGGFAATGGGEDGALRLPGARIGGSLECDGARQRAVLVLRYYCDLEIPGHTEGIPHHVSREEVLYVLSGTIQATVDGRAEQAAAGDVILVPTGAQFGVDNLGDRPATASGNH
jgi:mannose-6-phosphate isomerase-like protein (cupin superfamily)